MPRILYNRFLILIAGLGGLLYGIDVGIIAAALLYLGKTVSLSLAQTSFIVAAVLGGSMLSSPVAGVLAEWFGRRRMMVVSGLMFVASVVIIVLSQGFVPLFAGRLLQGMSGGMIAVVVPLYLAECLAPKKRGQGTAVFQFMLTFGIVVAALVGWYFTRQAEFTIAHAAGNAAVIRAAQNHAWRSMFLAVIFPGLLFFAGVFGLGESPRWLYRRGRRDDALKSLLRSLPDDEARRELDEMGTVLAVPNKTTGHQDSLLQRRYVVPFLLACVVLACNTGTGINSILGFLVIILHQAGLSAARATQGDVLVKVLNCAMTLVAVALVERSGRRFLLRWGTGGIIVALVAGALLFRGVESRRIDVKNQVIAAVRGNSLELPVRRIAESTAANGRPMVLSVLYSFGSGTRMVAVSTADPDPVVVIHPDSSDATSQLTIHKALLGPVPGPATSFMITFCMALFIAAYAVGPGVVVWLVLSEMIPTRIRSVGMGIALLLNQGVSTASAAVFLPVVGNYGYAAMFLVWAALTAIYFLTATFFLPETKGKTLEEIEMHFSARPSAPA
jgi:MFS transporter, SP family, solute carrier family 2 (myo-inositol transporter), member 13